MYRGKNEEENRLRTGASCLGWGVWGPGPPTGWVRRKLTTEFVLCEVFSVEPLYITLRLHSVCVCVVIADVHEVLRLVPSAIAASKNTLGASFLDRKAAAYRKKTTRELQNGHNIAIITEGKKPKINTE